MLRGLEPGCVIVPSPLDRGLIERTARPWAASVEERRPSRCRTAADIIRGIAHQRWAGQRGHRRWVEIVVVVALRTSSSAAQVGLRSPGMRILRTACEVARAVKHSIVSCYCTAQRPGPRPACANDMQRWAMITTTAGKSKKSARIKARIGRERTPGSFSFGSIRPARPRPPGGFPCRSSHT